MTRCALRYRIAEGGQEVRGGLQRLCGGHSAGLAVHLQEAVQERRPPLLQDRVTRVDLQATRAVSTISTTTLQISYVQEGTAVGKVPCEHCIHIQVMIRMMRGCFAALGDEDVPAKGSSWG